MSTPEAFAASSAFFSSGGLARGVTCTSPSEVCATMLGAVQTISSTTSRLTNLVHTPRESLFIKTDPGKNPSVRLEFDKANCDRERPPDPGIVQPLLLPILP